MIWRDGGNYFAPSWGEQNNAMCMGFVNLYSSAVNGLNANTATVTLAMTPTGALQTCNGTIALPNSSGTVGFSPRNTLDDGSGNMSVYGNLGVGGTITMTSGNLLNLNGSLMANFGEFGGNSQTSDYYTSRPIGLVQLNPGYSFHNNLDVEILVVWWQTNNSSLGTPGSQSGLNALQDSSTGTGILSPGGLIQYNSETVIYMWFEIY